MEQDPKPNQPEEAASPAAEPSEPAWRDELLDDPHAVSDKARRVQRMFAAIAESYDLNNRLHSMGRDQAWRRKVVRLCELTPGEVVLDAACGTGDLALAFAQRVSRMGPGGGKGGRPSRGQVIGVDFTHEMVRIAHRKGREALASVSNYPQLATLDELVCWVTGDATALPLKDRSVDVVTIAFGIRNVDRPERAVAEFARVLRPGGRLCILEFSLPRNRLMRRLYEVYFKHVMPRTATWVSGDRSGAYKYLPKSVNTFLGRDEMAAMMEGAGFKEVRQVEMTLGIAVAYVGVR